MASLDRRLNPLYAIKECSSCGNLHTKDCGCPKGSLEDKILVPIPDLSQRPLKIEKICLDCGDPVHGLYCRQCALIRKTLEEVFQDFQDTSKSSNDDTNFVNQEPFVVKQGPGVNSSQSPPQINHNCCYECGDSLDDIFCQRCTCKSCGKGAHYGYNCPPQIPIISKPEPCNNQTVNEFPQTLPSVQPTSCTGDENSFTYDSKPNFVDDSPNVFNPPPQPPMYSCEFCGNEVEIMPIMVMIVPNTGSDLSHKKKKKGGKETAAQSLIPYWNSSMIDDEEARDNFLKDVCIFLRKFSRIPFGVTPKVILIAWESFGEIKDALMDKQYRPEDIQELMSKLLEDVRNISEEFLEYISCPSWNRPLFYFDDDDDEYTVIWRRPKAITPNEPSEEPEDSLIMGENELSTIPEKDKSSVEDLDPIPNGSKGVSDDIYDHSVVESLLKMDEDEFDEEEFDCYDISSDDNSYENIEYVEASPLNLEYDSLEEENEDQEEKEFDLEDIFQIQDFILHEKLLNVHRLITNTESLKNNPTPDFVFKSPSSFPIPVVDSDSFFEESDTSLSQLDNSLPEFKTFSDHTEETRSGSTTTHTNNSLSEYDSFLFEIEPDQGGLTGVVIYDNSNDPFLELLEFESFHFDFDPSFPRLPPEPPDVEISLIIKTDAPVINNVDKLNEDECFDPGGGEINVKVDNSFTFVIWNFLPYLTYPMVSSLLSSTKNKDTIFDPVIFT
ncbi:hypothetical protein Tco_0205932 [Tanacetum coccineum]